MQENKVTPIQFVQRRVLSSAVDLLLPTKVFHVGNGLFRALFLRSTEGRDVFFLTTHPSETDEPREYAYVQKFPEFAFSWFVVPNASDQDTPIIKSVARATGIDTYPIVTQDVFDRQKLDEDLAGKGNSAYFRRIMVSSGNPADPLTVFLAPDAGRKPSLVQNPTTRAGEFLLTAAKGDFMMVFIGVEIDGVTDYENHSGKNLRQRYTLRFGNRYTKQELLTLLPDFRRENKLYLPLKDRPYAHFDRWVYATQFPNLVSESYKSAVSS